jgi:flavorubredoxin
VDWNVRDFHGYTTERGATYNAYLVQDEQTALIDTVKGPFAGELLRNLAARADLGKIQYVVCNHAEPDHSSGFPAVMAALPQAQVVCNAKCRATLAEYYDTSAWRFRVVTDRETLRLGARSLTFVDTPMVHWPESMATYVPEEKLLFSMDAFGQHFASSQRFDDEAPLCTVMEEARIYYANIVTPYSARVLKTLADLGAVPLEIIAPSHGVIWRQHVGEILKAYGNWAKGRPKPTVVVLYDSMWGSTARMAQAIAEGAVRPGVEAKLVGLRQANLTRLATEMLDCGAVAFGSSTLNQGMLPTAAAAVNYLTGLRFASRPAFAFGSYGWGKGGPEALDEALKAMKWELVREPLKSKFSPKDACLAECREAGKMLAEQAQARAHAGGYERLITD